MKLIVNNAMAFLNCEAPAAAPDIKPVQDSAGPDIKGPGFAQELKDCEAPPKEPYKPGADKAQPQKEEKGDTETKDNGMQDDSGATGAVYGIVGILEGFEPPGYQSDNAACTGEDIIIPLSQQTAAQSDSAAEHIPPPQPGIQENAAGASENQQASGGNTGQTSEQIARMLQNNDAGTKPVQTQDEILKIVGDYLDSLENTNSQASEAASADGDVKSVAAYADKAANLKASIGTGTQTQGQAELQGAASLKVAEEVKAAAPQTAETEPATGMAQSETKRDEAGAKAAPEIEASESKPLDTGKPESRNTAGPVNGAAVNAEQAAYKTETEQAEPLKTVAKPEAVRESVLRIVDRVKTEASEGRYDFDIDLKPDFMGKVSIKLTMEEGSIKVQIKAEEASVKAMLSDQTSNLHYMLKEKGIPVTTVDIASGDAMSGRQESAGESAGQYERRNPQGNAAYEQTTEGTFESAKERYDFYLGGSYVEYLA